MSMKFIMLINFKMSTIVGILTFIIRINAVSESLKAEKSLFFRILFFMSMKSFITLRPGPEVITFFHVTQLSMQFIMLINAKMSTIIGILTLISMIKFETRKIFIFSEF